MTQSLPARVLIVEDDALVRECLVAMLAGRADFMLHGAVATVAEAMAALQDAPDLILLDLCLPDGDGLDVIRAVRADPALAGTRILVLSLFSEEDRVLSALGEGADGYLLKDCEPDTLLHNMRATLAGETPISPAAAAHLLRRFRATPDGAPTRTKDAPPPGQSSGLSAREVDLLNLLAKGLSYAEASRTLGISSHTVHDHVKSIYRKLGVNSRGEAVFEAVSAGVISL
ncbi:MAG: response regulator transcription factor [Sphingomonadales bacterium]|jgi:DNA-binding NarL/FixJ family response regulator|nr:response regulator transcription factor [Sphingomonadales bacterium]